MRVVVNAVHGLGNSLGVVVENLLKGWDSLDFEDDLHLVVRPNAELDLPDRISVHPAPAGPGPRGSRFWAMEVLVPRVCRSVGADVMVGVTPATTVAPLPCPRAIVAHDLRYLHRPEQFPKRTLLLRRTSYAIGYRQADAIACVSNRTRDDLLRAHPFLARTRVGVAQNGADHVLGWPPRDPCAEYALAFGQWGNKNVDLVLDAWALLRSRGEELPLVVVGLPDSTRAAMQARVVALGLTDLVNLRPWLSAEEFRRHFTSSAVVVFPSDYEGFGLPAVEGMRLGIPVVVTPDPALLEVTGGLATVMDGWGAESLARAIPIARQMPALGRKLGVEHASTLTWQHTASQVRSLIVDCLSE